MKPKTAGRTTGSCHDANPIRAVNVAAFDAAGTTTCGITPDAKIVTMDGLRQLQDLRVGDRLVTRNQGAVPVKSIEQHSIVTRAVYIIAGSLGHSQPDRDTLLPAGQTIHVRDWRAQILGQSDSILAAAGSLVDGEFVRDIGFMPLTLYRIKCDSPQIIYADGMELGIESTSRPIVSLAAAPYAS